MIDSTERFSSVDLSTIKDFLATNTQVVLEHLDLRYLKLTTSGPILALLDAPTLTCSNATVVARWIDQGKGHRWAERINRRAQVAPAAAEASALGAAAIYDNKSGILFSEFPFDRRLPSLPAVVDNTIMLGRLRPSLEAHFGGELLEINPKVVRYRPEGKCVVRFELRWAKTTTHLPKCVFGKVAKESIFERSRPILNQLSAALGPGGFVVPTPITTLPDLSLQVFSALEGTPMIETLGREGNKDTGRSAGHSLRLFHNTQVELPVNPIEDRIALATDNAAQLAIHLPNDAEAIRRLCSQIVDRLASHAWSPCLTHGDFHPANVIVGTAQLGLIDFEDTSLSDPADDVGAMIAHLNGAAANNRTRANAIGETKRDFINAYDIAGMTERVVTYAALHTMLLGYQALRYPSPSSLSKAQGLMLEAQNLISGDLL